MSNYTTGEMAKLCNVSVRTVQFYDQRGVLHPSAESEGGRRIYNDNDLIKLRLICTLKAIGLSLDSIKGVLQSEMSGKILSILLEEQEKVLFDEINERQKQLEMICVIKERIMGKTAIPANSIIDIEHIMKKKNKVQGRKKLALVHIGVGIAAASGLLFMAWLIASRIWWGLAVYISVATTSLLISAFHLKDNVFICPKCESVFKPPLWRAFFTTGNTKVRWTKCPECRNKDWCVIKKQKPE